MFHDPDGKRVNFKGMSNKEIRKMVNDGKVLFYEDEIVNLKGKNPLQIRELGIRLSFVPEDRLGMGLVSNMNLVDNTMLRSYRHGHWIFLDRERPRKLIEKIIKVSIFSRLITPLYASSRRRVLRRFAASAMRLHARPL